MMVDSSRVYDPRTVHVHGTAQGFQDNTVPGLSPRPTDLAGYRPIAPTTATVPRSEGSWWVLHYPEKSLDNAAPTTIAEHRGEAK
jgi:hypothetical protein